MKPLLAVLSAVAISLPAARAADGPLRETALAISTAQKDAVVFLTAVVEIEMSVGESPTKKEERKLEILGTVIGANGLIAAPLSTLDVASNIDGRTVNTPQGPMKIAAKGTTKEVKIIKQDGSEIAAKMASKDPDLDLAFILPEDPASAGLTAVNTAKTAELKLLEDVVVLGRLPKDLNREPVVYTTEVISIINKPRTFGKIGGQALGMPVFNREGALVGLGINRFSPKGDTESAPNAASSVILPAADLLESASQVK